MITHCTSIQDSCILSKERNVSDFSLSGKECHQQGTLLGKQTADNRLRPCKLLKYNKYTLERARMGRCADENVLAKAFSQFEIASYQNSIKYKSWLIAYILAVMSHLGVEVPNCQI